MLFTSQKILYEANLYKFLYEVLVLEEEEVKALFFIFVFIIKSFTREDKNENNLRGQGVLQYKLITSHPNDAEQKNGIPKKAPPALSHRKAKYTT